MRARVLLAGGLAAGITGGAAFFACSPPPIGWQGAGRMQSLPAIQTDAGGLSDDAGFDTGMDSGVDSGKDSGVDAGRDSGVDSGSGSGTSDASMG